MSAELEKLEARIAAVVVLLGETGCYCECEHHPDEHGDDCARCLGCRVEAILNPRSSGQALNASEPQLCSELAKRDAKLSEFRRRLANIARDASEALPPGVGPINLSSYQTMVRALDRIAVAASIGDEEVES